MATITIGGGLVTTTVPCKTWQEALQNAITAMLNEQKFSQHISENHVRDTPQRVVKAFEEYFSGLDQDPEEVLRRGFEVGNYDEMVYVKNISFVSFCAHHLAPFIGKVHFAYLPHKQIVGLSKIPRLVEVYSKRPQVQEKLTAEIVDTFQKVVKPKGCGAVVEALHLCMAIRGVKKDQAVTRTTALRGCFKKETTKQEFLDGVKGVSGWF